VQIAETNKKKRFIDPGSLLIFLLMLWDWVLMLWDWLIGVGLWLLLLWDWPIRLGLWVAENFAARVRGDIEQIGSAIFMFILAIVVLFLVVLIVFIFVFVWAIIPGFSPGGLMYGLLLRE
jgi:hypothetical protein